MLGDSFSCPTCGKKLFLLTRRTRETVCLSCHAWLRRDDDRPWYHVEEPDGSSSVGGPS